MPDDDTTRDDERTARRAELLPEEKAAGSDDPGGQADAILGESDERTLSRAAAAAPAGPASDDASTAAVAATYFRAWQGRDWATLRSILHDDVTFDGPLATIQGADTCLEGLQGMSQILDRVDVQHVFVDGPDVVTWFDLHTTVADPVPTANWSHVEDGKVTTIRVAFDARSLAPPPSP